MRDHAQKEEEAEINMTPMLDIVFIMLIFFIVTAVFVKESGTTIDRPVAEEGFAQEQVSILIAVTDDDKVWLNREEVELEAVRPQVEKLHAENPRGRIVIQADIRSKAGIMMKVYDALREAGVETISIATEGS